MSSLSMSNDKTPSDKASRLKVAGIGVVTTLLYLWLAVRGSADRPHFSAIRHEQV